MDQSNEPDDSSQEARTTEVRKLVDEVLDRLNLDQEDEYDSADESDGCASKQDAGDESDDTGKRSAVSHRIRNMRSTRSRWKAGRHRIFGQKRSRRHIFKKHVIKSPQTCAVPVTSSYLFHRGLYYQIGDIVSVVDEGVRYFAQIRGFLSTEFCEHFAALTWLIPTREAPADGSFDATLFVPGPEEDIPRSLDAMEFEQHSPPDLYSPGLSAITGDAAPRNTGYIWTNLSPQIVRLEN
jgi:hypothetical protein